MRKIDDINRVVLKVGSSTIAKSNGKANQENILKLVEQIAYLRRENKEVLLVTSGAIAIGFNQLNLKSKPKKMELKQACSAIGQAKLMQIYEQIFNMFDLKCAQILLNNDDFNNRKRMNNLKNTIKALLENNIIPIINENDALAVDEIKVGDNDTLSALICPLVDADILILISDIDGLYNKNPKIYKDALMISNIQEVTNEIKNMASSNTSDIGTGGMITKIKAAKIANDAGCHMVIINGNNFSNITSIFKGVEVGTWFEAKEQKISLRSHWILYNSKPVGEVVVDEGAKYAILNNRSSLLPSGILNVNKDFLKDIVIYIKSVDGSIIGKGLTNYSSGEIRNIMGKNSSEIKEILKKDCKDEIIHANNIVIVREE